MRMNEVKEKAKQLDVNPGKMKKSDLIRTIQSREGNYACFQTDRDDCDQAECCWRTDCLTN